MLTRDCQVPSERPRAGPGVRPCVERRDADACADGVSVKRRFTFSFARYAISPQIECILNREHVNMIHHPAHFTSCTASFNNIKHTERRLDTKNREDHKTDRNNRTPHACACRRPVGHATYGQRKPPRLLHLPPRQVALVSKGHGPRSRTFAHLEPPSVHPASQEVTRVNVCVRGRARARTCLPIEWPCAPESRASTRNRRRRPWSSAQERRSKSVTSRRRRR